MTEVENAELTQDHLDTILRELKTAGKKLPVQAIQAARRNKERIIPELINLLQTATHALKEKVKQDGNGAFFALFLLAEFRASSGLPAILEAVSLPGDGPFELFGDAIHDVLPRVLIVLSNGQCVETCSALVRNSALNEYVRWSAANAIAYLARAGLRPRADIVLICKQLLAEAVEKKDLEAVTAMVMSMIDLNPWEAAQEIEDAFKLGLMDEGMIDWDSMVEHLQDKPMEPLSAYAKPLFIDDTIAELETWASFQEPKPRTSPQAAPRTLPPITSKPTPIPNIPAFNQANRAPAVRVGRNDPCPCGSGKKFKKCCRGRQMT